MKIILVKSLLIGLATLLVLALMLSLMKGVAFAELLVAPYTIAFAVSAALGSYVGFERKAQASVHM